MRPTSKEQELEIARLKDEVSSLLNKNTDLMRDWHKQRLALNRIAHPDTWGIRAGFEVEIARRALLIGVEVEPIPEGATITTDKP